VSKGGGDTTVKVDRKVLAALVACADIVWATANERPPRWIPESVRQAVRDVRVPPHMQVP